MITRGHLKKAVDTQNWDLLDKMLTLDKTFINDRNYYTDTWGSWWGLLIECIQQNYTDGVKILLKHGIDKTEGVWGDCIPMTPIEFAKEREQGEMVVILESDIVPSYIRKSDPAIPSLGDAEEIVNRRGEIADSTGLVFPIE